MLLGTECTDVPGYTVDYRCEQHMEKDDVMPRSLYDSDACSLQSYLIYIPDILHHLLIL